MATDGVFIALGSNIAPEIHLPAAAALLARRFPIAAVSTVWESAPVGFSEQPNFCNAALLLHGEIPKPQDLKQELLGIEDELHRVRDPDNKNGPRTIDLDIALFGQLVLHNEHVSIPDPQIPERPFLAIPLAELAPDFVHPELQCSLAVIAEATPRTDLRPRPEIILTAAIQWTGSQRPT
ncbi:MAG: 2-amino-4-hydroxy-6-hydroxymethyldihydropteridine diphosphokinase [Planctomycetaceae bacterium]|nr:2-amino-4-hydroxy-6-hydroxymethyldihydropteridine diphosphokinase [Planctomycetaceae bacterium]